MYYNYYTDIDYHELYYSILVIIFLIYNYKIIFEIPMYMHGLMI